MLLCPTRGWSCHHQIRNENVGCGKPLDHKAHEIYFVLWFSYLLTPISFSNVLFHSILYFSEFFFVIIVLYYICRCNGHTVVKIYGKLIIHTFSFNLILGSKCIWRQALTYRGEGKVLSLTQYSVTFQKHRWKIINSQVGWKSFWIIKEAEL